MDRSSVADELNSRGYADLGPLLSDQDIAALTNMYSLEDPFRSHIIMRRHGFGEGEYKYFANPLPKSVASLRQQPYSILAPIANHWQECVGAEQRFPKTHKEMLARCHADGQTRPIAPGVQSTARNAQDTAHHRDREVGLLRIDQLER